MDIPDKSESSRPLLSTTLIFESTFSVVPPGRTPSIVRLLIFVGIAGESTVKFTIAGCMVAATVNNPLDGTWVSAEFQLTFLTILSFFASYLSLATPLAVFSQENASGSLTPYLSLVSVA